MLAARDVVVIDSSVASVDQAPCLEALFLFRFDFIYIKQQKREGRRCSMV